MADVGVRTERFLLKWRVVEPTRGSYDWSDKGLVGRRALPRAESARPRSCGDRRSGSAMGPPRVPRSTPRPTVRHGRTSSRRRWRATGPAAATGPTATASGSGRTPTPLPIQSWQIWNEPNLKKYFAPGQRPPVGSKVRPAASDLPRRDQEPGSAGPDRARRNARLRGRDGLEVPRQPLRGARGQGRLRRRRPASLCAQPGRAPLDDRAVPRGDDEPRRRATPLWLTELAWGSGPPTSSATTRAPRVNSDCCSTPSG